jgi:hypothetical protein
MLHTHILDGSREAAAHAEAELGRYLESSMRLDASNVAQAEGAAASAGISRADRDAVAALGVRRFMANGLVCTVAELGERLAAVASWDVDEVACLIDFGFDHASILKSLDDLLSVLA